MVRARFKIFEKSRECRRVISLTSMIWVGFASRISDVSQVYAKFTGLTDSLLPATFKIARVTCSRSMIETLLFNGDSSVSGRQMPYF